MVYTARLARHGYSPVNGQPWRRSRARVPAIRPGDILLLICAGPIGSGMEEIYQVTSALRHLSFGKEVAVISDVRFSGVSTGACVGHVGPEALAGGPIGKVRDGDTIQIIVDRMAWWARSISVGADGVRFSPEQGGELLAARLRGRPAPHPALPDYTRLWAALQSAGGGTWGGCVYDVEQICVSCCKQGSGFRVQGSEAAWVTPTMMG